MGLVGWGEDWGLVGWLVQTWLLGGGGWVEAGGRRGVILTVNTLYVLHM